MKAIILAAGEWSRLRPLTNTTPKPLLKIMGKTILEHNLDSIYSHVSEIILVVKYKQEMFREYFWNSYKWVPLSYHLQTEEKWTAAAIKYIQSDEDVFILYGDSILHKNDLENILTSCEYWVLGKKVENPSQYGVFQISSDNKILSVVEKPENFVWDLINLGWFKMKPEVFELAQTIGVSARWEYELTDVLNLYVKLYDFYAFEITEKFIDISYPWDILAAHKYFLSQLKRTEISGEIEEWVTIKWNIILEEGAILKSGTYIEGNVYIWKNAIVWPNTYLRDGTVIWQGSKVWNAVELKNTSIWEHTSVAHLSYIWDSVIWNRVNIWGWFISANLRHDKKNIRVMIKEELIDSWLHKLWVIIWDNVKTWIQASSMPGRMVENNSMVMPGACIK